MVIGWSFSLFFSASASLVSLVTLGRFQRSLSPFMLRHWGLTMLRIQGVRVDVEGREHLTGQALRVALFNHSSGLDAMLIPTLYPRGGVAVVKREALYIPLVGLALYLLGFLLVDRARSERGLRTLQRAAERMEREQLSVFIAPEGTRSRDGELQRFKRGAFHLAMISGAPIVPIVVTGGFRLFPRHRWGARPGTIRVRILPPISTADLTEESMPAFIESVRDLYLRELD